MNPPDDTRRNRLKTRREIKDLQRNIKKVKKVIGLMANWIAETKAGERPLTFANAAQLIEKLK